MKKIYLDNAATSFPKPTCVIKAVTKTLNEVGGNPGRSSHSMGIEADRVIFETREEIASFFNISDSSRVVFTANATEALNLAIKGLLGSRAGSQQVVISSTEHNSVARPLKRLEQDGVVTLRMPAGADGTCRAEDLKKLITSKTTLVAVTHASNVIGAINPIRELGLVARQAGVPFLVDAAQTAGVLDIDVERDNIDLLACPGHKSLLGPQGTGFLYVSPRVELAPLLEGGTGSMSDDPRQPDLLPDKFESGTRNTPGIAGLGAALRFLKERTLEKIRHTELQLLQILMHGLQEVKSVKFFGPRDPRHRVGLISFEIERVDPAEAGTLFDRQFGIMLRVGLHCSPDSHRAVGSFPNGTIRVSPGLFTTPEEISSFLDAVSVISWQKNSPR